LYQGPAALFFQPSWQRQVTDLVQLPHVPWYDQSQPSYLPA
jgi:hypothetical protein